MNNSRLNVPAVLSYFSWIGWLIALLIRDRSDRFAAFHMNQSLVLNILSIIAGVLKIVPLLGNLAFTIVSLVFLVFWVLGVYRAIVGSMEPLPFIGDIHIID